MYISLVKAQKTYTVEEAKRALERYCAYQERCHKEVRQKLRDYKMIPEAQEVIIVHLIEHNFLNEERFAKSFVRGKFRIKHWGKQRMERELKFRNISSYNIKTAMAQINPEDYIMSFEQLALKKFNTLKETHPQKKKKKLADYLLYRGWESHLVFEKVNELIN